MFYLYHIKGVKWGCTKRLEQRLKKQGYSISDLDRLIIVSNVDKAAEMEKELNLEYRYNNQLTDYRQITKASEKIRNSNHPSILGKTFGKYNLKSTKESCAKGGKMIGNIVGNRIHTCQYCGKIGKGRAMYRWHMDNCKLKTS